MRHIKRSVSARAPGRQAKDNDDYVGPAYSHARVAQSVCFLFFPRLFLLSPDCRQCLVLPCAIGRGRLPFAFISSAFYVIITAAQWSP